MTLLDTDVCLAFLGGKASARSALESVEGEAAVSWQTVAELYQAALSSLRPAENRVLIDKFLLTVRILYPDPSILAEVATLLTGQRAAGHSMSERDAIICVLARRNGARLLTLHKERFT